MEFLNPFMLWGALAVSIPIILHFWHQKKGQLLEWAATTWLIEKELQQTRGIRLDNLLLLLLRCLLIILLSLFLSKPLLNWLNVADTRKKVHLIQADKRVVNNFKFEMNEAIKKGESLYWISPDAISISQKGLENIPNIPYSQILNPLTLQACINKVSQSNKQEQFEMYFINSQNLASMPNIFVPNKFSLHTIIDSANSSVQNAYLEFIDKKKLFINASNQLSSSEQFDQSGRFQAKPVHEGAINVLIKNTNKIEKQTIEASLKALVQVYQLELSIDSENHSQKKYDWIFTDDAQYSGAINQPFLPTTLFVVSGSNRIEQAKVRYENNIVYASIPFHPQMSELVFNGELPEWLGELLIKHYQLKSSQIPLSHQQLNSLFKTQNQSKTTKEAGLSKSILLLFLVILGIERWIAIKKNT